MDTTLGPHPQPDNYGTAPDHKANGPSAVSVDDTEETTDRQGEVAEAQDMEPEPVYDSGWTVRDGVRVRVRWYGVHDDGRRSRWFSDMMANERARFPERS